MSFCSWRTSTSAAGGPATSARISMAPPWDLRLGGSAGEQLLITSKMLPNSMQLPALRAAADAER